MKLMFFNRVVELPDGWVFNPTGGITNWDQGTQGCQHLVTLRKRAVARPRHCRESAKYVRWTAADPLDLVEGTTWADPRCTRHFRTDFAEVLRRHHDPQESPC